MITKRKLIKPNRAGSALSPLGVLLLGKISGIPSSPLFPSQAGLARAISELPDSYYGGRKELSLRSYLSQVLKGWCRCSEKLENCIIEAARAKGRTGPQKQKLETSVRQCVKKHNEIFVPGRHESSPDDVPVGAQVDIMNDRQETAKSVFIINPIPRELLEGAAITKATLTDITEGKPYIFCVPERGQANALWDKFRDVLMEMRSLSAAQADKELQVFEEKKLLAIYAIPPSLCVHPTVVYDIGTPSVEGWIWYVPYDKNAAIKWPQPVVLEYLTKVHQPITGGDLLGGERITWKKYKTWKDHKDG